MVRKTLTAGERLAISSISTQGAAAGLTREEMAPQLAQAVMGEDVKDLSAELTPLALEEWGIDATLSPTVALVCLLGPWSFGAFTAYTTLAGLAKEKAEREKKEKERK